MIKRDLIKKVKCEDGKKFVNIVGWIKNKKDFGKLMILNVVDSSGDI